MVIKMSEKVKKLFQKDNYNYMWAFLLTAITMFLAMSYANIVPGGKYYALTGDLFMQYSIFGPHLAEKIKEGSDFYYSFNVGMGINTSLLWAFYCFSPLDIFYFILEDGELATMLILIGKAALSSMFFQLFCRLNLKQNGKITILFSLGYGLCAYQILVLQMSSLTDGMYFLPLVLILVKKLVDEKKVALLTLVYASLFITNFYCGYIVGLSSFGYLCLYLFLKKGFSKKDLIGILARFAISAVVGFLMVAFVLFPAAYYVLHMENGGLESFDAILANPVQYYMCFFMGRDYVLETPFPYLYCGLPMLLIAPLYFINKKFSKKERLTVFVIILFFVASLAIAPLYKFMHMFNEPNGYVGRFVYAMCFILLAVAVRQFPHMKEIHFKKYGLYCVTLLALLAVTVVAERMMNLEQKLSYGVKEFLFNGIFIFLWFVLLYYYLKKETKHIVPALLMMGMLEMGLSCYLLLMQSDYLARDIYEYRDAQIQMLTEQVKEMDTGVYRMDVEYEYNKNNQTLYDYYDIGYFSSAYSVDLREAMYQLGFLSSGFCVGDLGGTEITDMLFGMKYAVTPAFLDGSIEAAITENPTALHLGYMVSEQITTTSLSAINAFENQEILVAGMTGTEYDIYEKYTGNVDISGENVEMGFEEDSSLDNMMVLAATRIDPQNELTYVKFTIPGEENRRMFAILSSGINMYNFCSPMVRTSQHNEPSNAHRPMLQTPHIVELDRENGNEYSVYITYPDGAEDRIVVRDMIFVYYNPEVLPEIYEELATNQMDIEIFEDGYIKGNVTATEESPILFMSVPYEDGWKVYVDGQEEDLLALVDGAFLGVALSPGVHEVEFIFEAPYSREGIVASIVGVVLFALLVTGDILRSKKRK